MQKTNSAQIALGGIMGALCIASMFLGSILPFATFVAPAVSGIFIALAAKEIAVSAGFSMYFAVSILSLLIVPEKEMACIFVFFFGFYPLIKSYLQKIDIKILRVVIKVIIFNACIVGMYSILLFMFPMPSVSAEFAEYTSNMILALLVLANITFILYDLALERLFLVYVNRLRPRFLKGLSSK